MKCDHLVYNERYELVSNYEYIDSELNNLIEYHKYICRFCGTIRIEPENFFITLFGFLPRTLILFLSLPFKLLKKMNIYFKKNDF
jgi:hypothetical protein